MQKTREIKISLVFLFLHVFFPCFSLSTIEILNLTSKIYKLTQTLIYLKSKLPQIGLEQYTQTCLVDEVKLTNEIEGVNSTRREIQDVLNTQSITQKNIRLNSPWNIWRGPNY